MPQLEARAAPRAATRGPRERRAEQRQARCSLGLGTLSRESLRVSEPRSSSLANGNRGDGQLPPLPKSRACTCQHGQGTSCPIQAASPLRVPRTPQGRAGQAPKETNAEKQLK